MKNEQTLLASAFILFVVCFSSIFLLSDLFIEFIRFLVALLSNDIRVIDYVEGLVQHELSKVSSSDVKIFLVLFTFIFWSQFILNKYEASLFWSAIVLLLFPIANLFMEPIWIRRFSFAFVILPSIIPIWKVLNLMIETLDGGAGFKIILKSLSKIFLLILVVPGFYLPPFYDGISGWYLEQDENTKYDVTGTKILFSNSSKVWFKPSFFSPITMDGRAYTVINRRDKNFHSSDGFGCMMIKLYSNAYPGLKEGLMPWQTRLGIFGYPPHNLDRFDQREIYLPPSEIVGFETVNINVSSNGKRKESIIASWDTSYKDCK